jgi:hypothetical protein
MAEEDEDESPHVNTEETEEEAQDLCLVFDDFTIEEDDRVFMEMVHPVNSHHFVRASSTVSGRLAEAFAKDFEDIVQMSLHTYADVFSEMAFDSLPEHRKCDHAIELECEPSLGFHKVYPMTLTEQTGMDAFLEEARALTRIPQGLSNDPDRADRDGRFPRRSAGHWTHQSVKVPPQSSCLLYQEERWKVSLRPGLPSSECHHQEESVSAPTHR